MEQCRDGSDDALFGAEPEESARRRSQPTHWRGGQHPASRGSWRRCRCAALDLRGADRTRRTVDRAYGNDWHGQLSRSADLFPRSSVLPYAKTLVNHRSRMSGGLFSLMHGTSCSSAASNISRIGSLVMLPLSLRRRARNPARRRPAVRSWPRLRRRTPRPTPCPPTASPR